MKGKWTPDGEGWRYGKAAQWPASPSQANVDVSCLLSMLTAGQRMGSPRINTFNGDVTPGKNIVSFEQWYHKVQCVKDHYPETVL